MNKFNILFLTLAIVASVKIVEAFATKGGAGGAGMMTYGGNGDNGSGGMAKGGKAGKAAGGKKKKVYGGGKKKKMSMGGYGGGSYTNNDIMAAVISKQIMKVKTVPISGNNQPIPDIVIDTGAIPISIRFKSFSSPLNVVQDHVNEVGKMQETQSVDGPIIMKHEVRKPILQEIREIITPSRKIIQEVQPVQQIIKTIVAQGQSQSSTEAPYATTEEEEDPTTEAAYEETSTESSGY